MSRRRTSAAPRRSHRHAIARWAPVVVAVATLIAFAPSLRNGFVSWDDQKNFLENPHYRGLGLAQLGWMWTTFHLGHYVPLSWMTLGLDYTLWGMHPAGYHLTSVLLHAVNAVLVYFLAARLFRIAGADADRPDRIAGAAAVAALAFALHPLRVESVVWVTERRDVLSLLFYLATVLAYLRSLDGGGRRWYWSSVALFVCALLSKATAMTAPAILLLLDVYPLRRLGGQQGWWNAATRRVYLELVPFALLSGAAVVLSLVALHPPGQLGLGDKVVVSVYSLGFYIWKSIAPFGLSPLYEMPHHIDATQARFIASDVVVAAAVFVAIAIRRTRPAVAAALGAFAIITLPMLGVVQNGPQIAADRYTYHAAPALAMLAGALLLARSRVIPAVAVIALVALGVLTWNQSHVWHDSEQLWTRVLSLDPESSIAHSAMATLLLSQDRVGEAMDHSRRAVALAPEYPEARNDLGVSLARQGRPADAIEQYHDAIRLRPDYDEAHANLGVALAHQGDMPGAIVEYQRAIELNPDNPNSHVDLGNAFVRLGRTGDAIEEYRRALVIRPDHADAHHNWGVALAREGKYAEAIEQFQLALSINPAHAEAKQYLERATALLQKR